MGSNSRTGVNGGNIWRLHRCALDEAWGAASVRAKEVGVGDHPECGVVLHHAALGVQSDLFQVAASSASSRAKVYPWHRLHNRRRPLVNALATSGACGQRPRPPSTAGDSAWDGLGLQEVVRPI
ncbi:hypothetical protein PR202_ga25258 [Eleusine coracana subsp. coracana]|uniref:Uncharacterized protein n=1 Tax=Eleusine coracana subsp. coracana TaxID=191504 RepID=A0AAV5DA73_ELECO|nr:hypothetical protein PR202_ga25258 [Eleusine coracana subsp. coracana]